MKRRNFVKYAGLGGAGLLVLPTIIRGCSFNGNGEGDGTVSIEGIMPIAFSLDCTKLLKASGSLNDQFRNLITADIHRRIPGNISKLGCSIPFETESMKAYLETFPDQWDPSSDAGQMKAALLLGWLVFHPLKKAMSEVYSKLISQGYHYDTITEYYDGFMLRQVSGKHGTENMPEKDLEEWMNLIPARTVTRFHTLKPDYLDGAGWVNRMSEWRKENVEAMQRVAGQYATDDQEMYNRFIKRYNVYREDDRLVELVRNMTKPEDPESVRKLILSDPGSSLYTKSMVKGYENILAAQDYFGGNSGFEVLNKSL